MNPLFAPIHPAPSVLATIPSSSAEIVSTCQVKTVGGGAMAVVGLRAALGDRAGHQHFYLCVLPANGAAGEPSSYDLRAIALQPNFRSLQLLAVDREVVYFVSQSGEEPRPVIVERGELFDVPAGNPTKDAAVVVLTFEGDYCIVEARSDWPDSCALRNDSPPPSPLP